MPARASILCSVSLAAAAAALVGCATRPAPDSASGARAPFGLHPVKAAIPPTPPGAFDIASVKVRPRALYEARPLYPPELRIAGVDGVAVVVFTVRTDGSVGEILVANATDVRFGLAAVDAISRWRFDPALVDGRPVNCRLMVPIKFSINTGG